MNVPSISRVLLNNNETLTENGITTEKKKENDNSYIFLGSCKKAAFRILRITEGAIIQ